MDCIIFSALLFCPLLIIIICLTCFLVIVGFILIAVEINLPSWHCNAFGVLHAVPVWSTGAHPFLSCTIPCTGSIPHPQPHHESQGIHNLQAEVQPVKKIILIFVKTTITHRYLSYHTICPGGDHDSFSEVTWKPKWEPVPVCCTSRTISCN